MKTMLSFDYGMEIRCMGSTCLRGSAMETPLVFRASFCQLIKLKFLITFNTTLISTENASNYISTELALYKLIIIY